MATDRLPIEQWRIVATDGAPRTGQDILGCFGPLEDDLRRDLRFFATGEYCRDDDDPAGHVDDCDECSHAAEGVLLAWIPLDAIANPKGCGA